MQCCAGFGHAGLSRENDLSPQNQKITNRHDSGIRRHEIGFEKKPKTEIIEGLPPHTAPTVGELTWFGMA